MDGTVRETRLTPPPEPQILHGLHLMTPLWNSLQTASITVALAFLLATGAARVRFSASRGLRTTLDVLFLLMLVLPSWLISFFHFGNIPTLMAAEMLPFFYFCAAMGFRHVNREAMDAARLQGLGQCGIFWRLFFPAAWPWLLGGLAFKILLLVADALHAS